MTFHYSGDAVFAAGMTFVGLVTPVAHRFGLLGQLTIPEGVQVPATWAAAVWATGQAFKMGVEGYKLILDARKGSAAAERDEALGRLQESDDRAQRTMADVVALRKTIDEQHKQIEALIGEKRLLLDSNGMMVLRITDLGKQIAANSAKYLDHAVERAMNPQPVEVVNGPDSPVPVLQPNGRAMPGG